MRSRSASPCGLGRVWSACQSVPQKATDGPGDPTQDAQFKVSVHLSAVFDEQPEQCGSLCHRQRLERRTFIGVKIGVGTFVEEDPGELEFVLRARPVVISPARAGLEVAQEGTADDLCERGVPHWRPGVYGRPSIEQLLPHGNRRRAGCPHEGGQPRTVDGVDRCTCVKQDLDDFLLTCLSSLMERPMTVSGLFGVRRKAVVGQECPHELRFPVPGCQDQLTLRGVAGNFRLRGDSLV